MVRFILTVIAAFLLGTGCLYQHPLTGIYPSEASDENSDLTLLALLAAGLGAAPVTTITPDAVLSVTDSLLLRYRADEEYIVFNNGRVETWNNLVTSSKAASQDVAALHPGWTSADALFNNRPAVVFEGGATDSTTGNLLAVASVKIQHFTIFTVFYSNSTAQPTRLVYEHSVDSNNGDGMYFNTNFNDTIYIRRGAPTAQALTSSTRSLATNWGNDGVPRVATHAFGGTHASHRLYLNGTEPSYNGSTFTADSDGAYTDNLYIGGRSNAFSLLYLKGALAEFLLYERLLSDLEREAVQCYLSDRYGIAVSHAC